MILAMKHRSNFQILMFQSLQLNEFHLHTINLSNLDHPIEYH
jgi:hypothetical protein